MGGCLVVDDNVVGTLIAELDVLENVMDFGDGWERLYILASI